MEWIFAIQEVDCVTGDGGAINIATSNGSEPYSYTWSGPDGGITNTSNELTNLVPGIYSVTVVDANNCQIQGEVTVPNAGIDLPNIQGDYILTCDQSVIAIGLNGSYPDLMFALANYGPVAISVDASHWHSYNGGIYDGCDFNKNIDTDHAVVAVGYGSDKDGNYFIVRNSWGPTYGEEGYIRVKRDTRCGMDNTP